jgi:deazaflavin-dependent oxidoreductase (nitroreductase family)
MTSDRNAAQVAELQRAPGLPPRPIIRAIWVLHRAAYRLTGGRFGLRSATTERSGYLRLKTVGRRTGKERVSILAYIEDGPALVTIAMNGWGATDPAWWLNLQSDPDATVELPDGSRAITARVADKDERARLWPRLDDGAWGDLDGFTATRRRETPIVILDPRR